MNENDLMQCPFCGGHKLKIDSKRTFKYGKEKHCSVTVRCMKCHARGPVVGINMPNGKYDEREICEREVIDVWNNRTAHDVVSSAAYEQVLWERDLALRQLREDYGVGLGEKKKDEECMWFITVMEKIEPSDKYLVSFGDECRWGYYKDYNTALNALHENWTDMWETCYDYAVLEKIPEGVCAICIERYWFKYDRERDGYFEIEEPECVKQIVNIWMS